MTLSVPAFFTSSLPAVSLPSALDPKGSLKGSPTDLFQNVLDSLTLFEDLGSQAGAEQQSDAMSGAPANPGESARRGVPAKPGDTVKKDQPSDAGSGIEAVLVPQTPSYTPPKLSLVPSMLSEAAIQPAGKEQDQEVAASDQAVGPDVRSTVQAGQSATLQSATLQRATLQGATPAQPDQTIEVAVKFSLPKVSVPGDVVESPSKIAPQAPTKAGTTPQVQPAAIRSSAPTVEVAPAPLPVADTPSTVAIPTTQTAAPVSTNAVPSPQLVPNEPTPDTTVAAVNTSEPEPARAPIPVPSGVVTPAPVDTNIAGKPASIDPARIKLESKATAAPAEKTWAVTPSRRPDSLKAADVSMAKLAAMPTAHQVSSKPAPAQNVPAPAPEHKQVVNAAEVSVAPRPDSQSFTAASSPTKIDQKPERDAKTSSHTLSTVIAPAPIAKASTAPAPIPTAAAPIAKAMTAPDMSSPALIAPTTTAQPAPLSPLPDPPASAPIATAQAAPSADPTSAVIVDPVSNHPAAPTSVPAASSNDASPSAPSNTVVSSAATSTPGHASANAPTSASLPQQDSIVAGPAPKAPLSPEAENFAFAMRMLEPEAPAAHASAPLPKALAANTDVPAVPTKDIVAQSQPPNSVVQQPHAASNQPTAEPSRDTASSSVPQDRPAAVTKNQGDLLPAQQKPDTTPRGNDVPVFQMPQAQPMTSSLETGEHSQPIATLTAQETHLLAPDPPKPSVGSEILLHLGDGGSQSSAAIRVADRAGAVSVSVHASDPVLRDSLRSNLGDLSAQLNQQGWKADVVKTAVAATHPESQQDSHSGGRGSQQQQQPSNGDRPQRDRRGNNGQWRQELEQQVSGGNTRPGGNR